MSCRLQRGSEAGAGCESGAGLRLSGLQGIM